MEDVAAPQFDDYDYDVLDMDREILNHYNTVLSQDTLSSEQKNILKNRLNELTAQENENGRVLLRYRDVVLIHKCLNEGKSQSSIYLHELLELSVLRLPSPAPLPQSKEYEARMKRLRLLADEAEYQKMTKNVSMTRQPTENLGKELRQMDSQATFLFNFVLTVVGAFAFGYKGVEYSLPTPNVSLQLTVGVTLATIVFFADIYFIIKKYV